MPSFWESQYVQFVRAFPSAVRALFNLIMAIFPLKVIMSMEGSRLDARPPAQLWSKMRKHYRIADVRAVPTFRQVLESELTSSALKYLGDFGLSALEDMKFNMVPTRLNATDVVIDTAFDWRTVSWRAHLWILLISRRFLNEGAFLLAFLQYINLNGKQRFSASKSLDYFIGLPLKSNYTELAVKLFQRKRNEKELSQKQIHEALLYCKRLFGREPVTGYRIVPWHMDHQFEADAPRLTTWAAGIAAVTEYVRAAPSIQQAVLQLNQVVSHGDAFVLYQCDLGISAMLRRMNQGVIGIPPNSAVAGPGMVPLTLQLAFNTLEASLQCDESEVAVSRDDSDSEAYSGVRGTKKRKSMFVCRHTHLRQSVGICHMLCHMLVSTVMKDICQYYNCPSLSCSESLYYEMEYFLCELRRLIWAPKKRERSYHTLHAELWGRMTAEWIQTKRAAVREQLRA